MCKVHRRFLQQLNKCTEFALCQYNIWIHTRRIPVPAHYICVVDCSSIIIRVPNNNNIEVTVAQIACSLATETDSIRLSFRIFVHFLPAYLFKLDIAKVLNRYACNQ